MSKVSYPIPVISLRVVRDSSIPASKPIRNPASMAALLIEKYGAIDREVFIVIHLDTRNQVSAIEPVSYGDLNTNHIAMREVFKGAILSNAASIILAHNHPSGSLTPSAEDVAFTHEAVKAGDLLDIEVLDHLVFSDTDYISMRERCIGFACI